MKVGILGSGDVGRTLAAGFLKHGHGVMIGSRTAGKLAEWGQKNPRGRIGGFDDYSSNTQSQIQVLGSASK
jgi:predicted dinucleotide-binding enzyme